MLNSSSNSLWLTWILFKKPSKPYFLMQLPFPHWNFVKFTTNVYFLFLRTHIILGCIAQLGIFNIRLLSIIHSGRIDRMHYVCQILFASSHFLPQCKYYGFSMKLGSFLAPLAGENICYLSLLDLMKVWAMFYKTRSKWK